MEYAGIWLPTGRTRLRKEDAKASMKDCTSVQPHRRFRITKYTAAAGKVASSGLWCAACGKWTDHQSGTCPTITH